MELLILPDEHFARRKWALFVPRKHNGIIRVSLAWVSRAWAVAKYANSRRLSYRDAWDLYYGPFETDKELDLLVEAHNLYSRID